MRGVGEPACAVHLEGDERRAASAVVAAVAGFLERAWSPAGVRRADEGAAAFAFAFAFVWQLELACVGLAAAAADGGPWAAGDVADGGGRWSHASSVAQLLSARASVRARP